MEIRFKKGNELTYKEHLSFIQRRLQEHYIPTYDERLELNVVLSYQHQHFNTQEKEKFFSSEYRVTNEISRMGYKLKGEPISSNLDGIISEGIAYGSIQIPNDGQPIVLLKERQTIGGYPKIGVVLENDCYKLAQAKPNTKIRFKEISMEEAIKLRNKRE
jgi:allophanate hydrolase subunit 2